MNPWYWEKHVMIQSSVSVTLLLLPLIVLFAQHLYNIEGTRYSKLPLCPRSCPESRGITFM